MVSILGNTRKKIHRTQEEKREEMLKKLLYIKDRERRKFCINITRNIPNHEGNATLRCLDSPDYKALSKKQKKLQKTKKFWQKLGLFKNRIN